MERIDYARLTSKLLREITDEPQYESAHVMDMLMNVATAAARAQREAIALAYERTGAVAIPNAIRETPLITDNESEAKDAD